MKMNSEEVKSRFELMFQYNFYFDGLIDTQQHENTELICHVFLSIVLVTCGFVGSDEKK